MHFQVSSFCSCQDRVGDAFFCFLHIIDHYTPFSMGTGYSNNNNNSDDGHVVRAYALSNAYLVCISLGARLSDYPVRSIVRLRKFTRATLSLKV